MRGRAELDMEASRTRAMAQMSSVRFFLSAIKSKDVDSGSKLESNSMAPFDVGHKQYFVSSIPEYPHLVQMRHRYGDGSTLFRCSTPWSGRRPLNLSPDLTTIPFNKTDPKTITWKDIAVVSAWGTTQFEKRYRAPVSYTYIKFSGQPEPTRLVECRSVSVHEMMRTLTMLLCVVADPLVLMRVGDLHGLYVMCMRLQVSVSEFAERPDTVKWTIQDCAHMVGKGTSCKRLDVLERWILYRFDWNILQRDTMYDFVAQHLESTVRPFSFQPSPGVYRQMFSSVDLDWEWMETQVLAPAMLVSLPNARYGNVVNKSGVREILVDPVDVAHVSTIIASSNAANSSNATAYLHRRIQEQWTFVMNKARATHVTDYLLPEETTVDEWTAAVIERRVRSKHTALPKWSPRRLRFRMLFDLE
jgi:hypothetical protein